MGLLRKYLNYIWIGITAVLALLIHSFKIKNLKHEARKVEEDLRREEAVRRQQELDHAVQMESTRKTLEREQRAREALEKGDRDHFEGQ